jgi:hypothetical protein
MFEKDGAPEGVPQSGGNSPYSCVNIDSWARHRVYKNKGYTILWADTIDDVQKHLFDHCV